MLMLMIAPIALEMILAIQTLALTGDRTQPLQQALLVLVVHVIAQLTGDILHFIFHAEVGAQKSADVSVFAIANEIPRGDGVGGVDIDVCTAVAVRCPAGLRAAGNHVCEGVGRSARFVDEGVDFVFVAVVDAEVVFCEGGEVFARFGRCLSFRTLVAVGMWAWYSCAAKLAEWVTLARTPGYQRYSG